MFGKLTEKTNMHIVSELQDEQEGGIKYVTLLLFFLAEETYNTTKKTGSNVLI
jgi:hypothetical protein